MPITQRLRKMDVPPIFLGLATILVLGFILTPIWITIVVSFNAGNYIVFPPTGISLRWYKTFVTDYMWVMVFKNSLLIAVPTMLVSTVVGVLAALGYMRRQFRIKNVINLLIMLPFLVPGIIIGICLLMFARCRLTCQRRGERDKTRLTMLRMPAKKDNLNESLAVKERNITD